jgi:hypothetical protein
MGLFIDERAEGPQREAPQTVFSGRAGGFPAQFTNLIGGNARHRVRASQVPIC